MGLDVGDEQLDITLVGGVHEFRAIQALLALALLHKQVVTAVAIERQFAASGSSDALFCAAVGLELGHEPDDLSRRQRKSKGKMTDGYGA